MLLGFCMRAEEWIMAFANCDSACIKSWFGNCGFGLVMEVVAGQRVLTYCLTKHS